MKNINNRAVIAGTVVTESASYECCGERFYSFSISTKRDSGVEDILPVNISQFLIKKITVGDKLCLEGQVRTYNKIVNGKSRLIVVFFAQEVREYESDINQIELTGYFCKVPEYRVTPLGREICDILLAVNRERGKSDYVPCICWGRTAAHIATLNVGAKAAVVGRFQSREYEKKDAEGQVICKNTAYEVSVNRINEVMEDKQDECENRRNDY